MDHETNPRPSYLPADTTPELDLRPIGSVLASHGATRPTHTALEWLVGDDVRAMSYGELTESTRAFARRLLALAAPRERVAVAASTSVDWVLLEYAAAMAGVALVPLNPALADDELRQLLAATRPRAVFCDEEFRGNALRARVAALADDTVSVQLLGAWTALPDTDAPLPEVESSDAFLVQPTSGTTGRPKGAVLSHRAAYNAAALSMARFGGRDSDRWLSAMPLHHVGGSVSVVLSMLSVGGTVTLVPGFEPGLVLDLFGRTGATMFGGVPTMYVAMLEDDRFVAADLSSLRLLQCGGSVVATSLIRRIEEGFGATVCNAYGQSESPNATMTSPDADDLTKAETIGTPLPHREVAIVDAAGAPVARGMQGELVMRSPLVMDGYLGVDEDTAAGALAPDGWLHTGDLCSMDDEGRLRIHGRVRDLIIRGGENITPTEVEDALVQHPAIAEIVVVGVADDRWGEVPMGVFRAVPGSDADPADLERYGRERLASFKVPRRWVETDAFPLTASGKIKRHEVRALVERSGAGPTTP